MPGLKSDITKKLSLVNKKLETYGESLPEEDRDRQNFLLNLLMKVGETFKRLANAEYIDEESLNALRLFANCKKEFADLAKGIRMLKPRRTDPNLESEVSKEIKKQKGKELPSFLSYRVFEIIVRKHIKNIESPAYDCLEEVNNIVEEIASIAIKKYLDRFVPLMMEVNNLMNEERMKAKRNTEDALKTIFAMESLVFTQDGNFTRLMKDIEKEDQEESPKGKNRIVRRIYDWFAEGEKMDAEHMVKCLEAYCDVAVTRLVDTIPMAIYYHLVKQLLEGMVTEMIKIASKPDSHNELLKEDPEIVFTKNNLLEKQQRLEKANIKLMKFGCSTSETSYLYSEEDDDDDL